MIKEAIPKIEALLPRNLETLPKYRADDLHVRAQEALRQIKAEPVPADN